MPPELYSLKGIIKKCDALYISGRGYTHEQLIKAVAQQMGLGHEDEGAESHLVELDEILVNNQSPLTQVLVSDAGYVLEVGDRVINLASERLDFHRKSRPRYVIETEPDKETHSEKNHFMKKATTLPSEGTVAFFVNHPHQDWRTNSNGYTFNRFTYGPLSVETRKHPDGTIELTISGITEQPLNIRRAIPAFDQPGVRVVVTWNASEIVAYFNGRQVDTISCKFGG